MRVEVVAKGRNPGHDLSTNLAIVFHRILRKSLGLFIGRQTSKQCDGEVGWSINGPPDSQAQHLTSPNLHLMAAHVHRDAETWAAIVAAWEDSGLSTGAFAANHPGLSARTLRSRIARAIGDADPHRGALRLAKQNARLWAEILSIARGCTCQAASDSVLMASCRLATEQDSEPGCQPATPDVTGPPASGSTECHAATSAPAPSTDLDAEPAEPPDVLDLAPKRQLAGEGGVMSGASPNAAGNATARPTKLGRAFWSFDDE